MKSLRRSVVAARQVEGRRERAADYRYMMRSRGPKVDSVGTWDRDEQCSRIRSCGSSVRVASEACRRRAEEGARVVNVEKSETRRELRGRRRSGEGGRGPGRERRGARAA